MKNEGGYRAIYTPGIARFRRKHAPSKLNPSQVKTRENSGWIFKPKMTGFVQNRSVLFFSVDRLMQAIMPSLFHLGLGSDSE